MPLDPTLEDLSNQGLPPPQPMPYGIGRAIEHQQRWGGTPSLGAGLQDIATSAGRGAYNAFGNFIENAVSGDPERQGASSGEFILSTVGLPYIGGEIQGGLGALRMARIAPGENRISPVNFGANDEWSLWSKETGKKLGEMYTNYDHANNQLKVEYMTGLWPEKFDINNLKDERSWGIGTHELQTLGHEVLREYPNIDTLKFTRVGGVFKGNPTTLIYKRVDTPEGPTFERVKARRGLGASGWVPPTQRFTPGQPTARPPSAVPPPVGPPAPLPPPPSPPAPSELPQHGPGWTREREESWDAMRQRQDAEWAALMQRLFGR